MMHTINIQKRMEWLQQFMWSSWKFPLFANAVCVVSFVVGMGEHLIGSWRGSEPCEWLVLPFAIVALFLCVGLQFWPIVMTVLCWRRRQWWHILRCWSAAIGISAACGAALIPIVTATYYTDLYMLDVELPEGKEYVSPRGMRAYVGDAPAPAAAARELLELRPRRQPLDVLVQMPPLPNLEKLTKEAPGVLQEYLLRCLYAEATNPRFDAQVLCQGHEPVLLAHANDPQSMVLGKNHVVSRRHLAAKRHPGAEKPAPGLWTLPLYGGWSVVLNDDYYYSDDLPAEEQVAGPLRLLDESLAPLAANPTLAGLDALLPPLPQKPFLCLLCGVFPGEYRALVILPPGHPDGAVELRAREVSTGKPVRISARKQSLRSLGNVCSADWHNLEVHSGNVNEFYATEWEIWFTPADGGEARCIGKQEFLMMGGG